jgi:hypothetical protein
VSAPITLREWAAAITLALVVLIVTGLPYVVGYATSTPQRVFSGFVIDVEDMHSHLAKMQQGYRGEWQYRILFTPEPHEGAYINTFYIALGHLARLAGLDLVVMYHTARVVLGLTFLMAVYAFVATVLNDSVERRLAYVLVCFSSGLGWLAVLLAGSFRVGGITPVDFWLMDMYGYFIVMTFPHICAVLALLLLTFGLALRYLETGRRRFVVGAALGALGVSLIHAFLIVLVVLVPFATWLLEYLRGRVSLRRLPGLLIIWLLPLPVVVYQYLAIKSNPVLAGWQAQNLTLSPPPWHYALGYGLVLILALPGGVWALRQPGRWPLLPLWLLIVTPLLYMPSVFPLQRRMIEGAQVPLCALAAVGTTRHFLPWVARSWSRRGAADALGDGLVAQQRSRRRVGLVRTLLVALTLPSTLIVLVSAVLTAAAGQADTVYSSDEVLATDWLATHSAPEAVIWASYAVGSFIPARSGRHVVLGHWTETVDLADKRSATVRFFGAAEDAERRALLNRYGVDYVFYGPREQALGAFDPEGVGYLEPVFRVGDVTIYRVTLE